MSRPERPDVVAEPPRIRSNTGWPAYVSLGLALLSIPLYILGPIDVALAAMAVTLGVVGITRTKGNVAGLVCAIIGIVVGAMSVLLEIALLNSPLPY